MESSPPHNQEVRQPLIHDTHNDQHTGENTLGDIENQQEHISKRDTKKPLHSLFDAASAATVSGTNDENGHTESGRQSSLSTLEGALGSNGTGTEEEDEQNGDKKYVVEK